MYLYYKMLLMQVQNHTMVQKEILAKNGIFFYYANILYILNFFD